MSFEFESALSSYDKTSISVREKNLTSEVMGKMDFGGTLYYLWTGSDPSSGETRLMNAMLSTLMVHGTTPSAVAARMTLLTEPDAVQAAISSGVLGVGSRFIGTMKECSEELLAVVAEPDQSVAIESIVDEYRSDGKNFPGIGHRHHDPIDPRAVRLLELAEEEGVSGEHVEILREIQSSFEERIGQELPINATGAIAAISADMGLSPTAARGLAVISRSAGVIGELIEEEENPMAPGVLRSVRSRDE